MSWRSFDTLYLKMLLAFFSTSFSFLFTAFTPLPTLTDNVEMEIVLPGDMTVRESHDIALALQHKIEGLEEVERAFVHVRDCFFVVVVCCLLHWVHFH